MGNYNLSFGVGGGVNHKHNSRENPPKHADRNKIAANIVRERDPEQLVNSWYKEEIAAYNEKQKKNPSRRIENLYQETKRKYDNAVARDRAEGTGEKYRNKAKAPEKEVIVAFGDMLNHPDEEVSKRVLWDWAKGFERRNPCFKVTGFYIHADEQNIHAHMDFAYKADEQPTINKMYSFENSLKQMGYERTHDKQTGHTKTAFEQWVQSERKVLQEIAREYGIELNGTQKEEKRKHLSREEYIQYKREKDLEKRKDAAYKTKDEIERDLTEYKEYAREKQAELKENFEAKKAEYQGVLDEQKLEIGSNDRVLEDQKQAKEKGAQEVKKINESILLGNKTIDELQGEIDKGYAQVDLMREYMQKYEGDAVGATLDLMKKEIECDGLRKELDDVSKRIKEVCTQEQVRRIRGEKPKAMSIEGSYDRF